ncbi:uncharacterized protein LOC135467881 [Liolophura sinensis]|uniref:uncharacterized protein LOC135467881 n=1 Tax=Liolophura sinensis TaxID=3198878 RepID=UPI00315978CC
MDSRGENSDASSDENAMVIDEAYEEKEEKSQAFEQEATAGKLDDMDLADADTGGVDSAQEGSEDEESEDGDDGEDDDGDEEDGDDEDGDDGEDGDDNGEDEDEEEDCSRSEGEEEEGDNSADEESDAGEEWETDEDGEEEPLDQVHQDSDSGDETENCPICLNKFRGQDIGNPETCDHNFCLDCIMEWATKVNTCPVDRQVFILVLAKHANSDEVYHKFPIDHKSMDESDEDNDVTYCEVCQQCDREDRLLLCDGCDKGYHCECLDPALQHVPVEEWFCPECAAANATERSSAESLEDRVESTEDEGALATGQASGVRRRRIPRTRASERVRTRIQANRAAIAMMLDSEDDVPRSSNTEAKKVAKSRKSPVKKKRTTKRKTKGKRKTKTKRKTTKRKTTKGKTTRRKTTKRKTKKPSKQKKKKRVVRPSTSSYSPRSAAFAPSVTPKARIAGRLGLSKPPVGRTIPLQKMTQEKSMEGQRAAVGISSLSILGCKDELLSFQDGDEAGHGEPQPGPSRYSKSALQSHRPVQKPPRLGCNKEPSMPAVVAPSTSCGPIDILGSIMQEQKLLNLTSKDITINRDGSLTANKPLHEDKGRSSKNEEAPSKEDIPKKGGTTSMEGSSSKAETISMEDTPSEAENLRNRENSRTEDTEMESEGRKEESAVDTDADLNKSPYTDSEVDPREAVLVAEVGLAREFDSPGGVSPCRDRNKSPPPGWVFQDKPVSPTVHETMDEPHFSAQHSDNSGGRTPATPVTPSSEGFCSPEIGKENQTVQENSELEKGEEDSLKAGGGVEEGEDQAVDGEQSEQGEQELAEDASGEQAVSSAHYDHVLSVDSDDSSREDSRPRVPISELPRIPKKKKLPNPIEVITIEDEDEEEAGEEEGRSVLQRLEFPESKSHWEKKESRGRSEDGKRLEGDRRDKKLSSRLSRQRDLSDDDDDSRRRSGASDKRRVVLMDKGGLIVTHGDASHSNKRYSRDRSLSRSREHGRNRSRSRSHDRRRSRDKWRSKEDTQRSGSKDRSRRKRRHERNVRSRSGSRSDHERHERSQRHKRKRRDRSHGNSDKGLEEETEDYEHSSSGRRKRSPKNSKLDSKSYSRDKADSSHKVGDKSKDRSSSKEGRSDSWKERHDSSLEKVDLREKLESRSKSDLREKLDSPFKGDLREKLTPKVKDKIDLKVNSGFKEVFHVTDWADEDKDRPSETSVSIKQSVSKSSDRVDIKKVSEDRTAGDSKSAKDEGIWPSELENKAADLDDSKSAKISLPFTKDNPQESTEKSAKGDFSENAIFPSSESQLCSNSDKGVFPKEIPFRSAPLLPTPASYLKNSQSMEVNHTQLDTMYDPSVPTDTASPPVLDQKNIEEVPADMPMGIHQRSDFVMGNRLQSPGGGSTGLLGDGSFFLPREPGMISVLPPQGLGQIPMSLGMLPPGFPPGLHSVPPTPHLVVNPLLLNRPPPFARLPQVPGGMPRFGWPNVDPQGVIQVQNRFERNPLKEQGMVPRFPGPFPPGPSPIPSRPNPVNGGFEGLPAEGMGGPRHFAPMFPVREDPRHAVVQNPLQPQSADGPEQHKVESSPRTSHAQTASTQAGQVNPLNEISKLLNLQAQLVGLTRRGDGAGNRLGKAGGKTGGEGAKGIFKVPLPPTATLSGSASRSGPGGKGLTSGQSETMEVVDMDMSPLDDDDNIVVSPDYEKDKKEDMTDKISSVVFLNKTDDLPSSAVELTNKQKAGTYMKKLHLQERVVEEVKLAIKPFYASKKISKEEYKDILRKSVPKICHSKSGDINPAKIKSLIEAYVEKAVYAKKKTSKSNGERSRSKISR